MYLVAWAIACFCPEGLGLVESEALSRAKPLRDQTSTVTRQLTREGKCLLFLKFYFNFPIVEIRSTASVIV